VRDASGCLVVGALAAAGAVAAGSLPATEGLNGTTASARSGSGSTAALELMLSSDGSSARGRCALRGEVLGLELHHRPMAAPESGVSHPRSYVITFTREDIFKRRKRFLEVAYFWRPLGAGVRAGVAMGVAGLLNDDFDSILRCLIFYRFVPIVDF
jgi:hypothetical protein